MGQGITSDMIWIKRVPYDPERLSWTKTLGLAAVVGVSLVALWFAARSLPSPVPMRARIGLTAAALALGVVSYLVGPHAAGVARSLQDEIDSLQGWGVVRVPDPAPGGKD